jgi:4-amino-4-deoxy-L-arabinose transferase-like glycosyltransferase
MNAGAVADTSAGGTEPRPSLSVIVPVKDGGEGFGLCLDALRASAGIDAFELIVVDDGSSDGSADRAGKAGATVLSMGAKSCGPAAARNRGAQAATGEVLVFIDADVVAKPDTLARFADFFATHPDVSAVFGSYDDDPAAGTLVSDYRNLLHHATHHTGRFGPDGSRPATTFWAGCGAVRRADFLAVKGYDVEGFPVPSIEDIELGYRLRDAGKQIRLCPAIQCKHLKRWTLTGMLKTDVRCRGIPWMRLLAERPTAKAELNIDWRQRFIALLVALGQAALPFAVIRPTWAAGLFAAGLLAIVGLNQKFYGVLVRSRGLAFAAASVPLHYLYYCCCLVSAGWVAAERMNPFAAPRPGAPVPSPAILIIMALAVLVRLAAAAPSLHDPRRAIHYPDSTEYIQLAENMLDGSFSLSPTLPYEPDLTRTPVYPAFVAAVYALLDLRIGYAALANAFVGAAACWLLFDWLRSAGYRRTAPWAAGALAADPLSIAYSAQVLSETLFTLLLIASLAAVWRATRGGLKPTLTAGVLLGLATLCRPIAVLLPIAVIPAMLAGSGPLSRRFLRTGAMGAAYAAVLSLWIARNVAVADLYNITSLAGVNAYFHRGAYILAEVEGRPVAEIQRELREGFRAEAEAAGWTAEQQQDEQIRRLAALAREHPGAAATASLRGAGRLFSPDGTVPAQVAGLKPPPNPGTHHRYAGKPFGTSWIDYAEIPWLVLVYPAALVGIWRLAGRTDRRFLLVTALPVAYFVLFSGAEAYARFRVPLMPLLLTLAAAAFHRPRESVETLPDAEPQAGPPAPPIPSSVAPASAPAPRPAGAVA